MGANSIQGNLVGANNMGHRAWAQVLRWSPKGAMFTGVKLNADPESEASVAVSLEPRFCLDEHGTMHEIRSIETDLRPVTLSGDVIVLSGDLSKTPIYNRSTHTSTTLAILNMTIVSKSSSL
ncbi:hypothetical protein ARMSODRAFT_1025970 [Armillaria solidipes]|uniref:Uncharacterized protein n=1 Tax=Armillaria solidipes TaxID=1076256 RepID=A0A2H3AQI0_9AGAR|nr:hypothetical protein ARMSODRAFT_1025970 [Armillaria solidipes]